MIGRAKLHLVEFFCRYFSPGHSRCFADSSGKIYEDDQNPGCFFLAAAREDFAPFLIGINLSRPVQFSSVHFAPRKKSGGFI